MKTVILALAICTAQAAHISTKKHGGRISGGSIATPGQFPFSAAIYATTPDSRHFCGGSLIRDQWILTSGECVFMARRFSIYVGSPYLSGKDPEPLELDTEDSYTLHPQFDPSTYENDIGLIKLPEPLNSSVAKPLALFEDVVDEHTEVVSLGWGQDADDSSGPVNDLAYVKLVTQTLPICKIFYGNYVDDNRVCAEGNYAEGTCIGDSGNPLLIESQDGTEVFLAGVASYMRGEGCEYPAPSVFLRVKPYLDWISNIISENS